MCNLIPSRGPVVVGLKGWRVGQAKPVRPMAQTPNTHVVADIAGMGMDMCEASNKFVPGNRNWGGSRDGSEEGDTGGRVSWEALTRPNLSQPERSRPNAWRGSASQVLWLLLGRLVRTSTWQISCLPAIRILHVARDTMHSGQQERFSMLSTRLWLTEQPWPDRFGCSPQLSQRRRRPSPTDQPMDALPLDRVAGIRMSQRRPATTIPCSLLPVSSRWISRGDRRPVLGFAYVRQFR